MCKNHFFRFPLGEELCRNWLCAIARDNLIPLQYSKASCLAEFSYIPQRAYTYTAFQLQIVHIIGRVAERLGINKYLFIYFVGGQYALRAWRENPRGFVRWRRNGAHGAHAIAQSVHSSRYNSIGISELPSLLFERVHKKRELGLQVKMAGNGSYPGLALAESAETSCREQEAGTVQCIAAYLSTSETESQLSRTALKVQ